MNELNAMRTFAQVIDTGSFANAARALDVAPAVVTRLVAELERHLGARLMTRTTRHLTLTEVGTRYLEKVRSILAAVDDAAALARHAQSEPTGLLRVRVPPAFAAQQLAARLPIFQMAHPQVMVELNAQGPVESIDNEHDITVVVKQPVLEGGFVARLLARSEVMLCAKPQYLDRHGRPTHPSQLADHPLLMPSLQRAFTLRRTGVAAPGPDDMVSVMPRRSSLNLMNPDLHGAGALTGLGIAGLPSFTASDALALGELERVLPGWHLFDLSIWACVPTRQHMPASARAFLDFLLSEFGGRERDPWQPAAPVVERPSVGGHALGLRAA